MELFAKHEDTLKQAIDTISSRTYWSPYPESPRAYDEEAPHLGEAVFEEILGQPFVLDQPATEFTSGAESSPYGIDLGITYPVTPVDSLIDGATRAMETWGRAAPEERIGVCLELLDQLKARVFEMAYAVMHTTGQAFLMAFQHGGPHALDRGLEGVAYAYAEMRRIPTKQVRWEKPQGKRDPIRIDKQWKIRPRGIAVAIGASTFPNWNGYPAIFASLATGNAVIIKPHPATILPMAMFVATARRVVAEAGFDPNTVQLAVDPTESPITRDLVMRPEVGIVDYAGDSELGEWLEHNVTNALVFTAKPGVNSVVIDSTPDLKGIYRNLSVSVCMYSGQMRTTPQNIYVPRTGIIVGEEQVSFDTVVAGLVDAIAGLLSDDQRAGDILGALKSPGTVARIADAVGNGEILLESRAVTHPSFPNAEVRTPVIVRVDAADRDTYMREMFGPIVYVVATAGTEEALGLARESAQRNGALTWLVYTADEEVVVAAVDAAVACGVPVAFNLTGALYVNHAAAFSDFLGTGANRSGSASFTDPAFVAGRFRVVGVRMAT